MRGWKGEGHCLFKSRYPLPNYPHWCSGLCQFSLIIPLFYGVADNHPQKSYFLFSKLCAEITPILAKSIPYNEYCVFHELSDNKHSLPGAREGFFQGGGGGGLVLKAIFQKGCFCTDLLPNTLHRKCTKMCPNPRRTLPFLCPCLHFPFTIRGIVLADHPPFFP